jgi:4-hydroxymandelate oxidase
MDDHENRTTTRRDMLLSSAGAVAAVALTTPLNAQVATATAAQQAPSTPLASIFDYEKVAKTKMTPMTWEYISGGAGDEITLAWNHDAYGDIKLRNKVLVDVSKIDTTTKLFGQELAHPILISPTAYHKLVHREGEVATARGASAAKTTMIVSSFATTKIEEIARAATQPLWFQLYVQPDREFTRDLVARVHSAGVKALVLTVDTPVLGARNRETRIGFKLPDGVTRENLVGLDARVASATHRPPEGQIYSAVLEPRLTWKDVDWLRSISKVPVLLKGILDPDDAKRAVDSGASGIIVSNHGARNLDTVPATITALPRVTDAVNGRIPVIVDGGVRRGTDVLKAIALGASAVGIGRPYLYGLAVDGSAGVAHVVDILKTELEMAMALTGRTTIGAIDRSVIWT